MTYLWSISEVFVVHPTYIIAILHIVPQLLITHIWKILHLYVFTHGVSCNPRWAWFINSKSSSGIDIHASNPAGTHWSRVRCAFTEGGRINNEEGHADVSSTSNPSTFGQCWIENPSQLDPRVLVSLEICWKFLGHSCQWWYINTETWIICKIVLKLFFPQT